MNKPGAVVPVILSGGAGTRLWPLSRALHPKQLIPLLGERSLLQETCERVQFLDAERWIVVCNEEHRFMVAEQLRQIGVPRPTILLEPIGRNTAPAIAVAALAASEGEADPLLLVLPADHVVRDRAALAAAIEAAAAVAAEGALATFGVVPTRAETGYGYIRAQDRGVSPVAAFVEKPDPATAAEYLASGDYYWNSGMFMLKASVYLEELARLRPEMFALCQQAYRERRGDLDFERLAKDPFAAIEGDSIDYAIMEHTQRAVVVPLEAGWDDVGSWRSLWDLGDKTEQGNVLVGDAQVLDVNNSYIRAEHRLVAAIGVDDHIIIETPDAVLVAHKDHAQDIKRLVDGLKAEKRGEVDLHRRVYRPWGSYEGIDSGQRFQVKRITVSPGEALSTQMHHHRAEHWVVVSGTARVRRGDDEFILTENESTFIPIATVHRLENPGSVPLELIEVQSGGYLGEDDIVRYDDRYGREGETK